MRLLLTAFTAFALLLAVPAFAHDSGGSVLDVPEGATLVSLNATERIEVDQDLLIASLYFKAEDKDVSKVQNDVNEMMKKALDEAKKVDSVKASTQQYHVYEYDRTRGRDGSRRDMVWQGQQGLQIKGKQADDLLKLTGKLQEMGFGMNGLSYSLSPEKMEEVQNSLLEDALAKLMVKAERTGKALGKTKTEVLKIDVQPQGGGYSPQPMMRANMAMDMAESVAAPVAAPGESQVSLNVSAQILLSAP